MNIHPATDDAHFQFNLSTDSGSNYNVTKTSSFFQANHNEADTAASVAYNTQNDLAQSTTYQVLAANNGIGNGADESFAGSMSLFNPASTTFVKHFISTNVYYLSADYVINTYIAGYANTTSALTNIRFKMSSGNIDAGTILMYGIN